jgi:hypothetical protein
MPLGNGLEMAKEKLFTEEGHVRFEGTDALQVGVPTKVTFTSKVKGEGNKFRSGDDGGEGTMTLNADGTVVASYTGSLGGVTWESNERSKVVEGEGGKKKVKGEETVTGLPQQIVMDTEMDLDPPRKFTNTGYEQK